MKTIATFFITFIVISITSCKKGYTCSCSSDSGFYDGFDIHASKKNAEKKCNDYYQSNYANQSPQDSTVVIGVVHCELLKGE
jgi:hypothetical protein